MNNVLDTSHTTHYRWILRAEVKLEDERDHDVQSWLMKQMGEYVLKRREAKFEQLETQVKQLSCRWAFL